MRLSECGGFGLVADEDVDIRQDLVERVFEELGDERRGEVKYKSLEHVSLRLALSSTTKKLALFFAAASSASALIAGTQTVKWKPPT